MLRGVDVSSCQGVVPWGAVADAGVRFAIIQAQRGNDGFDASFTRNVHGATTAGVIPFAYCFAYPLPSEDSQGATHPGRDPIEQAKLCVDRTFAAAPELQGRPFFLDLEWPAPQDWVKWGCTAESISAWCKQYVEAIALLTAARPVIYTYPDWWTHVSMPPSDVSWAADYPLWLASYTTGGRWPTDAQAPHVPHPWTDPGPGWLFWQFDGNGGLRLPNGVDADFCVFNGSEDDLKALALVT